jgi:signal transduction histidine kinase
MSRAQWTVLAGAVLALALAAPVLLGCGSSGGEPQPTATASSPAATSSAGATGPLTEDQVVAFVQKAADYVKAHGKVEALKVLSDPQGEFREGELYIFAEDFAGTELANGGQPEIVGQNLIDLEDANGVRILEVLIAAAKQGSGWGSYVWDNPETGQQQAKRAYVIKVGEDWYVGSGMYVQ